jgi:hypothetical protein
MHRRMADQERVRFILPGNNFHVYDIPLFWANLRADVERRAGSFSDAMGGEALPEDED